MGVPSVNYLLKMTINSYNEYTFFYKENLPYRSRFWDRKQLHKKTSKTKMNICSEGPFTPFPPWVEFLNLINLRKSANPNTYIR